MSAVLSDLGVMLCGMPRISSPARPGELLEKQLFMVRGAEGRSALGKGEGHFFYG